MDPSGGERKSRAEANIARLMNEAGSEASIERGRYVALGIVVIGMLGAVGSAFRPLYRQHFRLAANNVSRSAAAAHRARAGGLSAEEVERLEAVRQRLAVLQANKRARNPMLHGVHEAQQQGEVTNAFGERSVNAVEPRPPTC